MNTAIDCIHLPRLYENRNAGLAWNQVDGAGEYVLDCSLNESFEEAARGSTWDAWDEKETAWQSMDGLKSWAEVSGVHSTGMSWGNVAARANTWEEFAGKALCWNDIAALPADFAIYKGPGEPVPGPDAGQTWTGLLALDKTWEDIDGGSADWQSLAECSSPGLSWESVQARYLPWQEMEGGGLAWDDIETRPADDETHIGCLAAIPEHQKKAYFRVGAHTQSAGMRYMQAEGQPIVARQAFARNSRAGKAERVQACASQLRQLNAPQFELIYDSAELDLEVLPQQVARCHGDILAQKGEGLRTLPFRFERVLYGDETWSGLLVHGEATAKGFGSAEVLLEHFVP